MNASLSSKEILGSFAENGKVPGKRSGYDRILITLRGSLLGEKNVLSESIREEVLEFSRLTAQLANAIGATENAVERLVNWVKHSRS